MKKQNFINLRKCNSQILRTLLILFAFCLTNGLLAQNKATIDDSGVIELDKSVPLATTYEANVAHYSSILSSQSQGQAAMEQMFGKDYVSLSLNYASKKLTITIDRSNPATTGWTIQDWNNYLKTN